MYDLQRVFLQVKVLIEKGPSITLMDLSHKLGIERHTLEKAVRQCTGASFREFRAKVLLEHSRKLLKDQCNRSIKEVAFALGYRSQGSLSRFIRMSTGYSARHIRQESRDVINGRQPSLGPRRRGCEELSSNSAQ